MSKDHAFESLYQKYQGMVSQLCLGYVKGDTDQAYDLSQEVFINCWKAMDTFRGEASYKTWVYRVTVNTCLQHIRREKRRPQVPWQTVEGQVAATPAPDPAPQYRALYQAIGQLSELDRLIMMMVLDELDYEEIAHVTGLTAGNLRVRIHRNKKTLKTLLAHEQSR